jgi:hypothetical protein
MKLTYRGVDYDYNPPVLEATESEIKCQYRGQSYHYSYVKHVPIPQPAEQLTYRGVPYQTNRQGQVVQIAKQHSPGRPAMHAGNNPGLGSKLTGNSDAAQARRQLLESASRLHQDSIARSLQHRLAVAKQQGNQRLVEQLEVEMSQSTH